MHAQNKPLTEYGDLNSMHHSDTAAAKSAGDKQHEIESQPARLITRILLGGSYVIEWSYGDDPVPVECSGLWTGSTQAQAQIDRTMARLTADAEARAKATKTKAPRASKKTS